MTPRPSPWILVEMTERIDVWVLAFRAMDEGKRGLMRVFGIDASAAQRIVEGVPVPVRRGIPSDELDRWRRALEAIGATVGAGPAGAHEPPRTAPSLTPPAPELPVVEPLNESVLPIEEVPDISGAGRSRALVIALSAAVFVLCLVTLLARVSGGTSSFLGSAAWLGCVIDGLCVAGVAHALYSSLMALAFDLARPPSLWSGLVVLLGVGWAFGINQVHAPDPLDAMALQREIQAEVAAGRVQEARAFFAGPDAHIEGGTSAEGLVLVEALYTAGARRVYAYDGDADLAPEILVVELPVPTGTRQAIQAAYTAWMGSGLSSLEPSQRSVPDRGRFWNVPIHRDSGYF